MTLTQICGNALAAAGLSSDCAALPADRDEPGWFVVTHPSGQRFRFDGPAGQRAAATTVIQGLDLSAGGQATAETAALRTSAQSLLNDPAASQKALRALVLALIDRLNAIGSQHNALLTWLGTQTVLVNRAQLNGFALPANITGADAIQAATVKLNTNAAD